MKLKYIPNILSAIRIALVFAFAYVFFADLPRQPGYLYFPVSRMSLTDGLQGVSAG